MPVSHPLLDPHPIIAWDMDGTLTGDAPNAKFFHAYILAHPEKTHFIVTFRTGGAQRFEHAEFWRDECVFELEHHGVPHGTIAAVYAVPDDLYHAYAMQHHFHQPAKVDAFYNWKGKKAHELGATVLVDDMREMVIQGCEAHGVAFVNAHDACFAEPEG